MKLIIDIPEEMYEQIKDGYVPLGISKYLKNGIPYETVTEFADRCRECGAKYGKLLKKEPCEDAISRQAVLDYIDEMPSDLTADGRRMIRRRTLEEYISDTLPPVTPQPKTGHWIAKEGREQGYDIAGIKTWYIQIMCDKCGFIKTAIEGHTGQYHYCPNCGTRMQEIEE